MLTLTQEPGLDQHRSMFLRHEADPKLAHDLDASLLKRNQTFFKLSFSGLGAAKGRMRNNHVARRKLVFEATQDQMRRGRAPLNNKRPARNNYRLAMAVTLPRRDRFRGEKALRLTGGVGPQKQRQQRVHGDCSREVASSEAGFPPGKHLDLPMMTQGGPKRHRTHE